MRHAVREPESAEGEWREWGRGGERVTWPFTPGDTPPRPRSGHELTEAETTRVRRTVRRRPFHRLALSLLGGDLPTEG